MKLKFLFIITNKSSYSYFMRSFNFCTQFLSGKLYKICHDLIIFNLTHKSLNFNDKNKLTIYVVCLQWRWGRPHRACRCVAHPICGHICGSGWPNISDKRILANSLPTLRSPLQNCILCIAPGWPGLPVPGSPAQFEPPNGDAHSVGCKNGIPLK